VRKLQNHDEVNDEMMQVVQVHRKAIEHYREHY